MCVGRRQQSNRTTGGWHVHAEERRTYALCAIWFSVVWCSAINGSDKDSQTDSPSIRRRTDHRLAAKLAPMVDAVLASEPHTREWDDSKRMLRITLKQLEMAAESSNDPLLIAAIF
jgi:hypothetical protein